VYLTIGDSRRPISALTHSVLTILEYHRRGFSETLSYVNAQKRGTKSPATIQKGKDITQRADIVRERDKGATLNT
jgi:hypothetical protein